MTVELFQVSVFLAAFSGLYLTVSTVTDETYREQFFSRVQRQLERAVGVRAVYLALRGPRKGHAATQLRLTTLPVSLRGRSSRTTTPRGTL